MVLDLKNRAKPIIKWAGGKSGLLAQFKEYFPKECNRYIEPFLGGGAVYLSLKQGIPAIVNDSNAEIINLYKVTTNSPNELMENLDFLANQYSEEFYYNLRSQLPKDKVEMAARAIFLNKTGFNGLYRQNSKGFFNVPFGKRIKCPELYVKDNLLNVSNRLKQAEIKSQDFEEIIDETKEGDLVYCDPPYEPLSRTSSFNAYQANGFSQTEQIRLKEACERAANRGAIVLISNSSAKFILDLYKNFDLKTVSAKRAINSKGSKRGNVDELLAITLIKPLGKDNKLLSTMSV
ncbi:MAG: DNA adenine methylase [Candidatus Caenarcaniphilales bacterium]|nr:DNA adenine methylase [Candidatus Caenarcaniphilales bacterium]